VGAKEQSGRTWSSFHLTRGTAGVIVTGDYLSSVLLLLVIIYCWCCCYWLLIIDGVDVTSDKLKLIAVVINRCKSRTRLDHLWQRLRCGFTGN
jgi:hypothetical protein